MKTRAARTAPATASEAVRRLVAGNEAFGRMAEAGARGEHAVIQLDPGDLGFGAAPGVAPAQRPFAAVLGCADARVPVEMVFQQRSNDLFVVRVAGNFVNLDNLASFEYAVAVLGTPLLMVLGHEACGAVKSTISSIKDRSTLPGHLPALVASLTPAVTAATGQSGDLLTNATAENVRLNVEKLRTATPILSAATAEGRLKVVGGIYRLSTGQVDLLA